MRFQDDLASWVPMPDALRAEDERVNTALSAMDPGKLVVISGANEDALLEANDRVATVLDGAVARGELSEYRSLHALRWSRRLQERNLAALKAAPELAPRALAALEAAGVDSEQLAPFEGGLTSLPRPMSLRELVVSPLAPIASAFMLRGDRGDLLLVHLRGVRDEGALKRALAEGRIQRSRTSRPLNTSLASRKHPSQRSSQHEIHAGRARTKFRSRFKERRFSRNPWSSFCQQVKGLNARVIRADLLIHRGIERHQVLRLWMADPPKRPTFPGVCSKM